MRSIVRSGVALAILVVLSIRLAFGASSGPATAAPAADTVATATVTAATATTTSTATVVTPSVTSTQAATSSPTAPTASPTVSGTPVASQTTSATPSATLTTTPPSGPTVAYFAEGYTGLASTNGRATFTETLNILNPSSTTAQVSIAYYIQGNTTPILVTRSVTPTSVLREVVNTDVGPDKFVAAQISSPQRLYVTRTIVRTAADGSRLDGSTTQPTRAPARTWGFPEGYTGITFQQYLTILNPSSVQANVTVLLAPQASSAAGAKTLTLTVPALSRFTANIRSLNLDSPAKSVGMLISSDQPIVPERVIYFGDGAGSGKFGSTVSSGIASPSTQLRIAYASSGGTATVNGGVTASGNQAFITLLNPATTGSPVQVSAIFYDPSGFAIGQPASVTVAPGTRQTIVSNISLGSTPVSSFSVVLNASGPIEAESAQYYGGSPNVGRHPGVAYPAQASAYSDAFLSDLSTRLADGAPVNRDVFIYNPGAAQIQVNATYFGGNGATSQATYTVAAGHILDVDADQDSSATIPPGPLGAEFRLVPSSAGTFILYASGRTSDGLSATEDVGFPAY